MTTAIMKLLTIKFVNGERLIVNLNDVEFIIPARGNAKRICCKDGKMINVMMDKVIYTCTYKGEDVSDIDDGAEGAWN